MSDDTDSLTLAVIAERMKSLRDISERDFREIKGHLGELRDLPVRFEKLSGRVDAHEVRLTDIEKSGVRGNEYRRTSLPIIVLTVVLALAAVGQFISALHP